MASDSCVFCGVLSENKEDKILWQNETLAIIADHKPAAKHHFLVITKRHITDVRSLNYKEKEEDRILIEEMLTHAKTFLSSQDPATQDNKYYRFCRA